MMPKCQTPAAYFWNHPQNGITEAGCHGNRHRYDVYMDIQKAVPKAATRTMYDFKLKKERKIGRQTEKFAQ